jgi:hypothetical protein
LSRVVKNFFEVGTAGAIVLFRPARVDAAGNEIRSWSGNGSSRQDEKQEDPMSQNTTITINVPEDHLYHRYPGQTNPQPTHIEIDPETRTLSADWNAEIGNAVPARVWHGLVRRYALPSPYLSQAAIKRIMEDIAPLAVRVCDGFASRWDGHNTVGVLNEDAMDAEEAIERILDNASVEEPDCIDVDED